MTYFFCLHDVPESLKAQTVIGSLTRQLLFPISDLTMVDQLLNKVSLTLDFERIFSLFQRVLLLNCKTYFILNGLNECDYVEKKLLTLQLQKLQKTFILRFCISLRLELSNDLKLCLEEFITSRIIVILDDNLDIEIFIKTKLENCIESKKLVMRNPVLILEIQDVLFTESQEMFL